MSEGAPKLHELDRRRRGRSAGSRRKERSSVGAGDHSAGPASPAAMAGILTNAETMLSAVLQPRKPLAIIVCCYSGQPFFRETVDSIVRQTDQAFDIVFHDNGCHPGYAEEIDLVAAEVGAIVFRSDSNRYGEGLRFDVLPFLRHDYIAIIHDDDVYRPHKVARSLGAIREGNLDYLFTARMPVDQGLSRLAKEYDAINVDPIIEEDFPHRYIAELFYRGLRLHFSTLVMRTALARETLLGDPYVPRVADARFFAQLLLDSRLRGRVLPEADTLVRIHGGNDFLYEKFSQERRSSELTQLALGEFLAFQDVISSASDDLLARILAIFPGIPVEDEDDRVDLLVKAGMYFRPWKYGKKLIGAYCVHSAYKIAPWRTIRKIRDLTQSDANTQLQELYDGYVLDLFENSAGDR